MYNGRVLVPLVALSLVAASQDPLPPAPHALLIVRGADWARADVTLEHAERVERGLSVRASGGRVTSAVVERAAPFDELLPSWNVVVPREAGFEVELQVGRGADEWSPWLHVGDWGAARPAAERVVAFDGGRVAVDVFESDERWERCRWRLTGTGGAGRLVLERFALCFTDTRAMQGPRPAAQPGPMFTLEVPLRSQKLEEPDLASRVCSPTSVAMVLHHYGVEQRTREVARVLYDAAHDIYGNWNRAVQGAFTFGVTGHLARYGDWTAVEETLRAGTPLIVSVRVKPGELPGAPYEKTAGHLLVLVGVAADGALVCNDPAAPGLETVRRVYPRAALETVWMRNNGVAYVLDGARE